MFLDRRHRLISYHDTWISIDPVRGCPYKCAYCVLRHAGTTGTFSQEMASASECVRELLAYPLFIPVRTPLAIGNETDMLHPGNLDCLVDLLGELQRAQIKNPVILVTKAPLTGNALTRIRKIGLEQVIFFLSYSGLSKRYEPNFSDEELRENFTLVKMHRFPIVHYWRPLLSENTTPEAIERMLTFVSGVADATVFVGLKLHPELTAIITSSSPITVPPDIRYERGEWLEADTVRRIYDEARRICPEYRVYRHSSCALASVLQRPNGTATMFRQDICGPSQCPSSQRQVCKAECAKPSPNTQPEPVVDAGNEPLGRLVDVFPISR